MIAQSKPRRIKTPSAPIRDKFEKVHKASQSEQPPIHSEPVPEPSPEPVIPKAKKSNAWISHVKALAESKGIKFRDALRDPETKATYKK